MIVTLSFVITSCGGTSITASLMSTIINFSIPGKTMFKPGEASLLYFPNLSTSPLSKGRRILNILNAIVSIIATVKTVLTNVKIGSINIYCITYLLLGLIEIMLQSLQTPLFLVRNDLEQEQTLQIIL